MLVQQYALKEMAPSVGHDCAQCFTSCSLLRFIPHECAAELHFRNCSVMFFQNSAQIFAELLRRKLPIVEIIQKYGNVRLRCLYIMRIFIKFSLIVLKFMDRKYIDDQDLAVA